MTYAEIAKKDLILAAQLRAAEIKAGVPEGTALRLIPIVRSVMKGN